MDAEPKAGPPPAGALVDALASAVLAADERELAEQAAEASEDMADAAAALRERFLARVAKARAQSVVGLRDETETSAPDSRDRSATRRKHAGRLDNADSPAMIGRYPILRRLGSGGMGVVYAAYDEVLDRRLAIKVLHARTWDGDGRRRERLLREAQAMARVAHPNVVTVHEVGEAAGQPFVAMEFVSGPTLKEWLAAERRSWREIVPLFRQIADGLAALHDAGLVHRDVKPANVIIGDDGRVRVLDLGLVGAERREQVEVTESDDRVAAAVTSDPLSDSRSSDSRSSDSRSSNSRLARPLTMTGERLGTPAYMSREHFMGLELTPASDMFSLCVALYEALYRVHPFKAATFYDLQAKVIDGTLTPPPSSSAVPSWLHALVVRGLAPDPKDRPASMRELSSALANDPSRARRRWLGSLGLVAVTALAAAVITRAQTPPTPGPTCDGAVQAISAVWSAPQTERVVAAMRASALPYAPALSERTTAALDDYAADWAASHERVCVEHNRGQHSDALLDARMACLDRARQALAETVALLSEADDEVIGHAGEMVAKLPRLDACDDLAALARDGRDGDSPASAAARAELDALLVRADALANAGRSADAVALSRHVAAEAAAHELPATEAEALLAQARAAMVMQIDRETVALLDQALALSIEHGLDSSAAEAMIRRVYARGLAEQGNAEAIADLPIAEAMLLRAGDQPELRALLLNNTGAVQLAAGDRPRAKAAFEQALALKERLFGSDHLELALGLANVGMLTDDPAVQRALHTRMIEIYERRLGPDHPRTLDGQLLAAMFTADPEHAGASLRELCPRLLVIGEGGLAGECELARARVELARMRPEIARPAMLTAREQLDPRDPRGVALAAQLAAGTDDAAATQATLAELIRTTDEQALGSWWIRVEQAERRLVLAELRTDRPDEAIELLERARAELDAVSADATPVVRERLVAATESALARVLASASPSERARITALTSAARHYYENWPRAYARRLDELDAIDSLTR